MRWSIHASSARAETRSWHVGAYLHMFFYLSWYCFCNGLHASFLPFGIFLTCPLNLHSVTASSIMKHSKATTGVDIASEALALQFRVGYAGEAGCAGIHKQNPISWWERVRDRRVCGLFFFFLSSSLSKRMAVICCMYSFHYLRTS